MNYQRTKNSLPSQPILLLPELHHHSSFHVRFPCSGRYPTMLLLLLFLLPGWPASSSTVLVTDGQEQLRQHRRAAPLQVLEAFRLRHRCEILKDSKLLLD